MNIKFFLPESVPSFFYFRRMEISEWRNRIDELESMIIELLNKRASYAVEIGKIKKEKGLPVLDPVREQEILARVAAKTKGPLSPDAVREIFKTVMQETRKLEM